MFSTYVLLILSITTLTSCIIFFDKEEQNKKEKIQELDISLQQHANLLKEYNTIMSENKTDEDLPIADIV
jgi:hypothetical protein